MAEAAAVQFIEVAPEQAEVYAHSLKSLRHLGELACQGTKTAEYKAMAAFTMDDLTTAVTEMLKTDPEFREHLDVDRPYTYKVINGEAQTVNGRSVVTMLAEGLASSEQAAQKDSRLGEQAKRDAADLQNARRVNQLPIGTARLVVSMDPKEGLATDPDIWKGLGYRKGIAYLQWYCREDEDTIVAGAYSIDKSNLGMWRELFSEFGIDVPEGIPTSEWIQYGLEVAADAKQAELLAVRIRERYYDMRQSTTSRRSLQEFMKAQQPTMQKFHETYYTALADAIYRKQNNATLQGLAQSLLQAAPANLKPELRQQLIRVANSKRFNDEAGRAIDSIIRYAAAEELRKKLKLSPRGLEGLSQAIMFLEPATVPQYGGYYGGYDMALMHQIMAANVRSGVQANRSYGGCAGQNQLSIHESSENAIGAGDTASSLQEAFGGQQGSTAVGETDNEPCVYSHSGCYCCDYNDDGSKRDSKLTVKAYRDRSGTARCLRYGCDAYLDADGKGDIGNIARRAAQLEPARS
ncbi:MAG: hypothetical protein JWM81_588 [Candidatus Saccharibacteria bacterium]|nr:hypothetical protein [Candidatus Saccharibacteria bacterium]